MTEVSVNMNFVEDVDDDERNVVTVEFDTGWRCTACKEYFADKNSAAMTPCKKAEEGTEHDAVLPVFGWANAAHIEWDPEQDSVTVGISTGDERGSFTMEIRRSPEGRIFMHVPYPDAASLHEPLLPLHEGTYAVNEVRAA